MKFKRHVREWNITSTQVVFLEISKFGISKVACIIIALSTPLSSSVLMSLICHLL